MSSQSCLRANEFRFLVALSGVRPVYDFRLVPNLQWRPVQHVFYRIRMFSRKLRPQVRETPSPQAVKVKNLLLSFVRVTKFYLQVIKRIKRK